MNAASQYKAKALKVTRALESLDAANSSAETWMREHETEVPEWFPEFVREMTIIPIPLLETELTRLDILIEATNAKNAPNAAHLYPELSDDMIKQIKAGADLLAEAGNKIAHLPKFEFTNEYFQAVISRNPDVRLVRYLLADQRIDPAENDNYALQLASQNGHLDIVQLLLADPRINPLTHDTMGLHPSLINACENGHTDVVRELLKYANPRAKYNYAIRVASKNGHAGVVQLLLADGRANPGTTVYRTSSPIHLASSHGHVDVVRLLLADPRVDPSLEDNCALRFASENGHVDIVRLLLADPRVRAGRLDSVDTSTVDIHELIRAVHRGGKRSTRKRSTRKRSTRKRSTRKRHQRRRMF